MLTPFEYQVQAINDLRNARAAGKRRLLLCMLMGAGKTLCAMELMRLCQEKGMRSMFLCDRRMLADQGVDRAADQGLDAGLIMSGRGHTLDALCQFASKQTVESWLKTDKYDIGEFDLIIVDEAHRAVSPKWQQLFNRWPNATRVGLTATPCLGNGDGMGQYYDYLCQPITPSQLKAMGRLVPVKAYAPHVPDLKGCGKDKDGDYSAKSLSERMRRENMIGDISGWWKKLAQGRPSIYFGCDVAHALSIRDDFWRADIPAEIICDETPDDERKELRRRLENGELSVVVNCDVLAEGVDWPFVSCIGLVRPTKRLRRYLQNAGRGMRSHPGKENCLIIDHSGCVLYHGFPDTDREWPLDSCDNIDKQTEKKNKSKESSPIQCSECSAVFSGTRKCPECGKMHAWQKTPKDYAKGKGSLVEVGSGTLPADVEATMYQRFWGSCIGRAIKLGKPAAMAAGMFRGKFGMAPWDANVKPMTKEWRRPAAEVFSGFLRNKA